MNEDILCSRAINGSCVYVSWMGAFEEFCSNHPEQCDALYQPEHISREDVKRVLEK